VLRRKVAETGAGYEVVKNSLIERAAQGTKVEVIAQKLRGTTSVAYSTADPVALARVLTSYAKEFPALVIKAGLVEGRIVSLEEFDSIATLPSREALFARALYLVRAPAQQLVVTLSGVARNLARVIQQGIQEKKFNEVAGN
jgi:large subunit ribosomal protein L10